MTDKRITATMALLEMDSRARSARTVTVLLDRLRRYMRAIPAAPDRDMPEHDVVWVASVSRQDQIYDSPEQTILEAIRQHPELWATAVPPECCIVPRQALTEYLGPLVTEAMEQHGENLVLTLANRRRYEAEQEERRLLPVREPRP